MPRTALKAIWVFVLFLSDGAQASYEEYLQSLRSPSFSDYGTIGLVHMPSARMMPEGSLAFRWARGQPYFRGSIVATPFSRMEPHVSTSCHFARIGLFALVHFPLLVCFL